MKHEKKLPFKCCPSCRKTLLVLSAAPLPFQLLAGCQGEVYRRMWLDSTVEGLEMQPVGSQPVIPTYLHNNSPWYRARVTPPNCPSVRPSLWLCRGEVWGETWCGHRQQSPMRCESDSPAAQLFLRTANGNVPASLLFHVNLLDRMTCEKSQKKEKLIDSAWKGENHSWTSEVRVGLGEPMWRNCSARHIMWVR